MWYKFVRIVFFFLSKIIFPYKIIGTKGRKTTKPTVVICNHFSVIDPVLIGACFKDKQYFLCKKDAFKHKLGAKFISSMGAIPINREKVEIAELKTCLNLLKSGKRLVVFPEGTRNRTAEPLKDLKDGAGIFSVMGKTDIIPIYIYGRSKLFRKNYVLVGDTFTLEEYYGKKLTEENLTEINKRFASEMLKLREDFEKTLPQKTIKKLALKQIKDKKRGK